MLAAAKTYQAGLVFIDDTDLTPERLIAPTRLALDLFGIAPLTAAETSFDHVLLTANCLSVELRLIDPREIGDEMPSPDAVPDDIRPAVTSATLGVWIRVVQHRALPQQNPRAGEALLAELLHALVETTGAPFIQWQDAETILTSRRFQAAVTPIRHADRIAPPPANVDVAPATAPEPVSPRRIQLDTARARCGRPASPVLTRRQIAEMRRAALWSNIGEDTVTPDPDRIGLEAIEDVFRVDVDLPPELLALNKATLEQRVATWTVNASVVVLSPPVGAALLTYNMLKGENFRLSTQALTLTGAFMGLGLTKAVAATVATVAMLPF